MGMGAVMYFGIVKIDIFLCLNVLFLVSLRINRGRGHRSYDRMVVGFTTTYVISAYHH